MSRAARRLLAQSPFGASSITPRLQCLHSQQFSTTLWRRADEESSNPTSTYKPLTAIANLFGGSQARRDNAPRDPFLDSSLLSSIGENSPIKEGGSDEPHHFHVYATKHNTHITLTRPNRDPIMSCSAGNIGFRKSSRKHYDSAFQLASYVMGRIQDEGINAQIKGLEVCLRGFGAGREAVTKAFLGNEGRFLRKKVVKVSDATRLKFGGTRSKKPRRLG